MRLLVTRPEAEAAATAARLTALGHAPLLAPLLAPAWLDPPAPLPVPAAILLTSGNGLRALLRWPAAASWRDRPVLAVGDRTAAAARAAGFADVRSASGNAGDLEALARRSLRPESGMLVHPAGSDPAGRLAERLAAAGFRVETVPAYRMDAAAALPAPVVHALENGAVDGVLLYSPRTAAVFAALAERHGLAATLDDVGFYLLSAAVAAALPFGRKRIAATPDEDSLLALLSGAGTSTAGVD